MKNLYKFFLALGVCTTAFSQMTEITRLPVQDISQSIKESTPICFLKIKTILNEFKKADRYEDSFNVVGFASGVYIYQLRVNDPESSSGQAFITSKKMVLIK